MPCDKIFLLLIEQVLHGSGGLLPTSFSTLQRRRLLDCSPPVLMEEVVPMNITWQELFAFCLVILETIELIVQIKKK